MMQRRRVTTFIVGCFVCAASFLFSCKGVEAPGNTVYKVTAPSKENYWQKIARADLKRIRHLILDRSTVPLTLQPLHFKRKFDAAYMAAKSRVAQVHSYEGYRHVLQLYINSLHIPHFFLIFKPDVSTQHIKWPGFLVGQVRPPYFQVVYAAPKDKDNLPPIGARLIGCDDELPEALFMHAVAPFMFPNPKYKGYWPYYAPELFINEGNSFVNYPHQCTFAVKTQKQGGGLQKKLYTLKWYPFLGTQRQYRTLLNQARNIRYPLSNRVSVRSFGNQSIWIRVPSFEPNKVEQDVRKLAQHLPTYRNKKIIVFDLRQNGGGSRTLMESLIIALYGKPYLASLGPKEMLNRPIQSVWRVNKDNIQAAASHDLALSQALKKAQKQGKSLYHLTTPATIPANVLPIKTNPVKAHVILLTDSGCWSACWLFVRDMRAIPGVTQVGQLTGIMEAYSTPAKVTLHKDLSEVAIPMMQFLSPTHHFGKPFIPQEKYQGDITDTAKVQKWVLSLWG